MKTTTGLTLTRKEGEGIYIGEDIEIVVREIRKSQVRISVRAPRHMKVARDDCGLAETMGREVKKR